MSSQTPVPGIVSTADQTRPDAKYLPLESLEAHVYIADVSARVVLCQLYSNATRDVLKEAHYVFPVPANAAVCSFEMRTDSGRRLKGVVKEIKQAKEDYEAAVLEGRLAALLQQFRQDVFVVCIGTILPRMNVTITLSYVIDLSEGDQRDTVRFYLPSHIGARYGAPPTSALYRGTAHRARASITVDIDMASSISSVECPTHTIRDLPQSVDRHRCVKWVSMDTFLDKDFVLVVQASGLDMPRCLAETLSPSGRREATTTALALTIVPRFNITAIPEQEYIFLIDRSGSMEGQKIEMAKAALKSLVRMLPASGSLFNIFSFGSYWTSFWPQSQHYDNCNLGYASSEIDKMAANLGGTQLLNALIQVFHARSSRIPTSIFVLTDGQIYNTQQAVSYVRQVVSSSPDFAPVRLFTLGIGDGASTELCQGIAEAGNGFCSMTLQSENIFLKSIRLVNAMRVATVEALKVDWGASPDQGLQAPDPIPTISPDVRMVVTTILSHETPAEVVLTGRLPNGSALEFRVPVVPLSSYVNSVRLENAGRDMGVPPLIHTLAAHRYIKGLDTGSLQLPDAHLNGLSPSTRRELTKNRIVELGTQYEVASSCTAFVAVDAPNPPPPPNPPRQNTNSSGPNSARNNSRDGRRSRQGSGPNGSTPKKASGSTSHGNGGSANRSSSTSGTSKAPSSRGGATNGNSQSQFYAFDPPVENATGEVLILSDPGSGGNIICTAPPLAHTSIYTWFPARAFWSVLLPVQRFASSVWQTIQQTIGTANVSPPPGISEVSQLQAADGSFSLTNDLSSAVSISAENLRSSLPPDLSTATDGEQIWATAIAVAFFRSKCPGHKEMWETLQEKAITFCSQRLAGGRVAFEDAVKEALKLFS